MNVVLRIVLGAPLASAVAALAAAMAMAGEVAAPATGGADAEVLPQGFTEITARQVLVETAGIGNQKFREAVEALGQKIMKQGTEGCEAELSGLLREAKEMLAAEGQDAPVISVSADLQFADYIAKHDKVRPRRAEWAFQKLFFLEAFVLADKGDNEKALAALDALVKFAPYCSDAYCERGYLLNRAGRPEEALRSYRQAAEITEKYGTERHNQAVAWRGMGFSLTSLGKYAEARQAYEKSLEFAADNKIAREGLAAISQLEKKK